MVWFCGDIITFAIWANTGFDTATSLNLIEAWVTSLSYTFQLYFDFSGYTDMAIGTALLFNIKLPINFNAPYQARNIQDFWRRWHMTLSRFLRDYIYIPLGGSKNGKILTYRNLIITFLLGGIWHGAGWTFIFWGFLHGVALVIHSMWKELNLRLWSWIAWLITFNFVNFSWIFFRAKEWDDAIKVISGMLGFNGITLPALTEQYLSFLSQYGIQFGMWIGRINGEISTLILIFLAFLLIFRKFENIQIHSESISLNYKMLFISSLGFIYSILSLNKVSEFLYFNF